MNIQEELGFLKMWFETIHECASTRRNANGIYISPERMLIDISIKAKDAAEYIDLLLK